MIETLTKPDIQQTTRTLESRRRFWQSINPEQRRKYWEVVHESTGQNYVRQHPLYNLNSGKRVEEPPPVSPFNLPDHDINYKVAFLHSNGDGVATVSRELYPKAIALGIVSDVDARLVLEAKK
jgi:hypothetical protein